MDTKSLPTSPLAIEAWLRSLSTPEQIEQGGTYPYLFGMATVKLAEAHAEIELLRTLARIGVAMKQQEPPAVCYTCGADVPETPRFGNEAICDACQRAGKAQPREPR